MRYTIAKENEVRELAAQGKSSAYISSATNVPERVIWGWCPETRPHDDVIKWSVKQRYHSIFPDLEAKISGAISPLIRTDISEEDWDNIGNIIYSTLFEEAMIVFRNVLEEPPEFGSERRLSKEPFLDYLRKFWSEDSEYAKRKKLNPAYIKQNHDSVHFWSLLKKRALCEVNTGDIERVFEKVSDKGLSQSRVNAIMKVGLIPLKQAYKDGLILNRCHEFILPCVEKKSALSPTVVSKIFNSEWTDTESFVANLVACSCHLQLQETRALRLCDISDGVIEIKNYYSDRDGLLPCAENSRTVKVSSFITDIILKYASTSPYHDFNPTDYIFFSESRDKPAWGKKWSKHLVEVCKEANVPQVFFNIWSNSTHCL